MPYQMPNGKWRAKRMIRGKMKTKVFPTKREAQRWEVEQNQELWETQDLVQDCQTHTVFLLDVMNEYLKYVEERFVIKTFKEKVYAVRQLFKHVKADATPDVVTRQMALSMLRKIARTSSGNAANKVRKNLAAAWEWGKKYHELQGINPFHEVEKFPADEQPRYVPPESDFWRVYNVASDEDKVLLLFLLHTGARRGEAYRLVWNDVDFDNNKVRLGTRKTGHSGMEYAWLPMTSMLNDALRKHKEKSSSSHVFVSAKTGEPFISRQKYMCQLCAKAGVKPFGFHAIRHLAATILAYAGLDIPSVQSVLRHHNPNTTARYIKSLGVQQDKLEAVFVNRGQATVVDFTQKNKDVIIRRRADTDRLEKAIGT